MNATSTAITPFYRHRRRAGELPQRRLDRGTPKDVRLVPARGWRSGRCPLWSHPGMRWLPPRNTGARDVLVAGVALLGGAGLVWLGTQPLVPLHAHVPAWAYLLPLALASAGLALRRRAPLTGLAVAAVAICADAALGGSLATALVFTQVLYEACLHGPAGTWRWLLRISTGVTAAAVVAVLAATGYWRARAWAGVVSLLLLVLPVVTGLSVRQYRDQAEA